CHPAAEGRPGDDLLLDEARHLVAGAAEAALGPVERQRRLPGDEVGEPGGVAEVGPAGAPPALAQLRGRCRLANHDPAAVRVPPEHPPLAEPARVARVAQGEERREARRPDAVPLGGEPGGAKRREQRIVPHGERGLEPRVDHPRPPPTRCRNREDVVPRRRHTLRARARDPALEQTALEPARRVNQEYDPPPGRGPPRLVGQGTHQGREAHQPALYRSVPLAGKSGYASTAGPPWRYPGPRWRAAWHSTPGSRTRSRRVPRAPGSPRSLTSTGR